MADRKLISFDWAMKSLLRDKANFAVLEGFLSELLKTDIKILELLESESNKESEPDKFNRIDLKAKNSEGEIIVIEVQYESELFFLQRLLYASSKNICEHMSRGDSYKNVAKIISVSILYFDLGKGNDYIYVGKTNFHGYHDKNDLLELSDRQKEAFTASCPADIFPVYYLLRVNKFDEKTKSVFKPIDEWLYFLKNASIKDNFTAKGISEASKALDILKLSPEERIKYDRHIDQERYAVDVIETAHIEGRAEGRAEGREEGRAEGREEGRAEGREEGRAEGREEGRAEGREEGRAEGREEGKIELLLSLVKEGVLSVSTAAHKLNISQEEFSKYL